MRPILAYASPVWGYAAKTNTNILDTLQNSLIRMIVKATRYMRNDDIRKALKITSFKAHIQKIAINFFDDLPATNNYNMQNLIPYIPNDNWQPIGVTVHCTQQPIRQQSLSSQPSQKLFQIHHPDEAPKPRLLDSIDHPIAIMPPSRM
ncbi:uncharacterized protein TNCV_3761491 [Trichonephila clavipes]|nr:uncharacterized protein TNCV_3761491 [Trichonephila clavipes]